MGVEAARAALRGAPRLAPAAVYFATATRPISTRPTPPRSTPRSACPTPRRPTTWLGAVRSGGGRAARRARRRAPTLAVLADIRTGLPGGARRARRGRRGGGVSLAGAGDGPVLAEPVGAASATRGVPRALAGAGRCGSRQWEERFGEHAYVPLAEAAIASALKQAGVTAATSTALIVAGPHGRARKPRGRRSAPQAAALADDLTGDGRQHRRRARRAAAGRRARPRAGRRHHPVVSLADGAT